MDEEKKVSQQNEEAAEHADVRPVTEETETKTEEKAPKKSKKMLIIAAAAVLVLAAAALLLFSGDASPTATKQQAEAGLIVAHMAEDGSAYLPLYDGSCIEINDDVDVAVLSRDRNHLAVLLTDGTLYVTDTQQTEKQVISDKCSELEDLSDGGLLYSHENGNVYRVLFSDYSEVKLGKNFVAKLADNSMSLIAADDQGNVYSMAESETELVKRGKYEDSVFVNAISDDGLTAVWTNGDGNNRTIYLSEGDERFKLGELSTKYSSGTGVSFSADQKMLVVTNLYTDSLWIKKVGEEPVKAKLGATLASSSIYTANGLLSEVNAEDVREIYANVDADSQNNIYCISMDGDRERVLSNVQLLDINGGKAIYKNEDGLYYAEVKGAELGEEKRISGEASGVLVSDNGRYVYYFKNVEDESGALYCYKLGEDDAVKITGDAASSNYPRYQGTEAGQILFFKDAEKVDDSYSRYGTLYIWSYGDEKPTKVTSEVMMTSIASGYEDSIIDINNFSYIKYNSVDKSKNILGDMMLFDGKESSRLASDVNVFEGARLESPAEVAPAAVPAY